MCAQGSRTPDSSSQVLTGWVLSSFPKLGESEQILGCINLPWSFSLCWLQKPLLPGSGLDPSPLC